MQKAPGPGVAHSWNILDFSWVLISVNLIFVPIFLPCYGRCTSCILQLKMGLTIQFINPRKQTATILTESLQYFALVYWLHYPFSIGLYTFLRLHIWLSAKQAFSDCCKVNSKDSGKKKKKKSIWRIMLNKLNNNLFRDLFPAHMITQFFFPTKKYAFSKSQESEGFTVTSTNRKFWSLFIQLSQHKVSPLRRLTKQELCQ